MKSNVLSLLDSYKISHPPQYPKDTQMVHSGWTIRGSRLPVDYYIFFGLQYFLKEYFMFRWNDEFFSQGREAAMKRFRKTLKNSLNVTDLKHYEALHELGYLPLEVRALPEGSKVNLKVPCFTVHNTFEHHPEFYWLTNSMEVIASCSLWGMINNATIAAMYAEIRRKYLQITVNGEHPMEPFLNHNFAYRGMMGNEAAVTTDAAWLLFSKGSDTVPGIEFMEDYYNADSDKELISCSIPATEHSVACAGGEHGEAETYRRMIDLYKNTSKIFSFVCDTWDYFHFLDVTVRENRQYHLESGCKVVLRPDSSKKTPLEIICGDEEEPKGSPEYKGSLNILWEIYGGTKNSEGFKVLHPQIGLIYGEAISPDLYQKILWKMVKMGYCVSNLVVGVGSYSQTYHTRDTLKQAFKATAIVVDGELREIYKSPKTDDGTKKSARGLLTVRKGDNGYYLKDQATWDEVESEDNCLKPVFRDGKLLKDWTLGEVREIANKELSFSSPQVPV